MTKSRIRAHRIRRSRIFRSSLSSFVLAERASLSRRPSWPQESVEQILPPLIVAAAHQAHDVAASVEVEGARFAHQLHAGFERKLVALSAVAGVAASHKILPGGGASARARDHVIQGQLARGQHGGAILASITIAKQDIFS